MTDINENPEIKKPQAPVTPPAKSIGGWLLLFIIGTFATSIMNFVLAVQTGNKSLIGSGYILISNQYFASLLGLLALVTGIMLIAVRNIYSVWTARFYMIMYLVGSIVIAITGIETPSGYYVINEEWIIIQGIISAALLNLIWQSYFFRSKRVKATYPKISDIEADTYLEIGKTFTSLFNKQKLGINYYVSIGLFLILVISWFLYSIYDALWYGYPVQFPPISYFLAYRIPLVILYSILLIFLLHTLRNDWLIAVAMGVGTSVLSLIFQLIYSSASFGNITISNTFAPAVLFFNFTWSFFLLLVLGIAMRTWGFKWWSFIVWVSIGNVVEGLLGELINLIQYNEHIFSFSILPISILQGIIEGTIFYFSIYFFLKRKGIILNKIG